jgi:hypothetical protein
MASFEIQSPPSAEKIKAALTGADLKKARGVLLDLHCNPKTAEQVAAVRQAWHEIGSPTSTEVMQDHPIQALMAECLIEAQPQNATRDPDIDSAVVLLRTAIQSQDVLEALSGAIGLIHFSDPRDMQSIIDVTPRTQNDHVSTGRSKLQLRPKCRSNPAIDARPSAESGNTS